MPDGKVFGGGALGDDEGMRVETSRMGLVLYERGTTETEAPSSCVQ